MTQRNGNKLPTEGGPAKEVEESESEPKLAATTCRLLLNEAGFDDSISENDVNTLTIAKEKSVDLPEFVGKAWVIV